jgi:hypothetical protein
MKMSLMLVLALLTGCGSVTTKMLPTVEVKAPTPKTLVLDGNKQKELKKLLKNCKVYVVEADSTDRPIEEVAVDLALARKSATNECNKRLQKARALLNVK